MKLRKILALWLVGFYGVMSAQDTSVLDKFYADISKSCVELDYTYSVRASGVNISGDGILTSQGVLWTLKGNGIEMYCDSSSLWVVDSSLKEVTVESALSESDADYTLNPAILLVRMKDFFRVTSVGYPKDGLVSYVLRPISSKDIEYVKVDISAPEAVLQNADISMADGNLINIKVSSMELTPIRSAEFFRPVIKFDTSWIITDLR